MSNPSGITAKEAEPTATPAGQSDGSSRNPHSIRNPIQ